MAQDNNGDYPKRREFARHKVTAVVDYTGYNVPTQRVQNLSLGGLCVHTPVFEEVGASVELTLKFPTGDSQIQTEGEVVWINRDVGDVGIRFTSLNNEQRERLAGLIKESLKGSPP